jgi:hypothetical protein
MKEMVTIRRSEYESLQQQISDFTSLVELLRTEIALLKNGKDSRTGSTSPSQDTGRSNRHSLRTKVGSGKKPGDQKGHPGHHLSMVKIPNKTVEHIPHGTQTLSTKRFSPFRPNGAKTENRFLRLLPAKIR